jgi:hypothetical protein
MGAQVKRAAERYLDLKAQSGASQANASPLTPDQDLKLNIPVEDPHGRNTLEHAGHNVADALAFAFSSRSGKESHRGHGYVT